MGKADDSAVAAKSRELCLTNSGWLADIIITAINF